MIKNPLLSSLLDIKNIKTEMMMNIMRKEVKNNNIY